MHQRKAARVAREVGQRIGSRAHRPVQVHLEGDVGALRALDDHVERRGTLDGRQFAVVVVEADADVRSAGDVRGGLKRIGDGLATVHRGTISGGDPGEDEPLVADLRREVHGARPVLAPQLRQPDVRRWRGEAVLPEDGGQLRRRATEVSGKLDFLEAGLRHLRDRALHRLLHEVAHGVQLHAEPIKPIGCRRQSLRPGAIVWHDGGRGQRAGGVADELSAVNRHAATLPAERAPVQ